MYLLWPLTNVQQLWLEHLLVCNCSGAAQDKRLCIVQFTVAYFCDVSYEFIVIVIRFCT